MPSIEDEVEQHGFMNVILGKTSIHFPNDSQIYYFALDTISGYYGCGESYSRPIVAINLLKKHPEFANKIWADVKKYIQIPTQINQSHCEELIKFLRILKIHYENMGDLRTEIDIDNCTETLNNHLKQIETQSRIAQATINARINTAADRQKSELRRRTDIDADIISKLTANPPMLPWEINTSYMSGPYRTERHYGHQLSGTEYTTIPLYDALKNQYPELIELANRNKEREPRIDVIHQKMVVWQQQLLRQDRSIQVPTHVLNALLATPPRLPWALNLRNTRAPGYHTGVDPRGDSYQFIELRSTIKRKYEDLVAAADRNPDPASAAERADEQRAAEQYSDVDQRRAMDRQRVAEQQRSPAASTTKSSTTANTVITKLIEGLGYKDVIDDIDIPEQYKSLVCPVTMCLMRDPVSLSDGITMERSAAETALRSSPKKHPLHNAILDNPTLTPNVALRNMIEAFLKGDEMKHLVEQYKNKNTPSDSRPSLRP